MLSYTLLFLAALATAQKATTWPPSLPGYDPHVNTQCNSSPTNPKSFSDELQRDFNDQNSLISGLIQAACDPNYEKSILYGSCSGNDCFLTAHSVHYSATYTIHKRSPQAQYCLSAPFTIINDCKIAAADSDSPSGGTLIFSTGSGVGGGGGPIVETYELSITPRLPDAQCIGDDFSAQSETANLQLLQEVLCADDACKGVGEKSSCSRDIPMDKYRIHSRRQNKGSNKDYSHCTDAMNSIINDCYGNGKGGGKWQVDETGKQASQEFYQISFENFPKGTLDDAGKKI